MANQIVIASELGNEFLLGTETANKITIAVDNVSITKPGDVLTATPGVLTYDNLTTILTYTSGSGAVQNIDLSAFTTDIFVDGGSFDAVNSVLTLTDNDAGTPDVTVDLSSLLGVSTDANNALTNGADGKPFLDSSALTVATDAGNILTDGTDGAYLDCPAVKACATETCTSVFGTQLFTAFTV